MRNNITQSITRSNNQIRSNKILLIDETGDSLGEFSRQQAMQTASDRFLDLIELTYKQTEDTSICKLGDVNKFIYEKKKKEKEQEKKQRENSIDLKEIYLRASTDKHDIEIKAKKATEFIENGDRVRVVLKMKNRELSHKDVGVTTFNQFISLIDQSCVEKPMKFEGNNLVAQLFKSI